MKRTCLTILLLLFLIISGCHSSNSEYESITIENYQCSYSLEYPSSYETAYREAFDSSIPFSYVILNRPVVIQEALGIDPDTGKVTTIPGIRGTVGIYIDISDYKIHYGDSYAATDRIETVLEGLASWPNFKLLNRSPLTVSGVQGELIEYLVDRPAEIPSQDGKDLDYHCAVYFDYNGLLWTIEAKCIQELKEYAKADFDYMVQSFKIIR